MLDPSFVEICNYTALCCVSESAGGSGGLASGCMCAHYACFYLNPPALKTPVNHPACFMHRLLVVSLICGQMHPLLCMAPSRVHLHVYMHLWRNETSLLYSCLAGDRRLKAN